MAGVAGELGCARRLHGAGRMLDERNNACRLCFSEADELPGLVTDKYGELVILQLLAKGLHSAGVRESCVRVLREELQPAAILERPDPQMRELEGLAAPSAEPLFIADRRERRLAKHAIPAEWAQVFISTLMRGRRPGRFLISGANYAAAAEWARKAGSDGQSAGCVLLPGRVCAAPGAGLRTSYGDRCVARFARSGGAES